MKRGSALLIVLGMIAFMVISAVAFSAFMRNSRLPSSYLRRTSYSRLLVKAALAEAIDLIDISIGDNPHPGVGTQAYPYPRRSTETESSSTRQRNYWVNRVFIGTNQLVNADQTVSTLTFEALAYLPPALINETRYYSRRSAAAVWHNLGFDSGRYAFTAVDVSDHFDINRTVANVGRNSSDAGKISLAYAFENAKHTGYTVQPSAWDTFMDQFVDASKAIDRGGSAQGAVNASKLPFVSLADFNLAVNEYKGDWAQNMSPFCRYVTSKGGTDFVTSSTGADSEMMRNMLFVTDGLYGNPVPASGEDDDYDLNDAKYQPFRRSDLESVAGSCATPLTYSSDGMTRLYESLCGLGLIGLWDYLDTDNLPLSLAVPTVERVPMVCAIEPKLGPAKLSFAEKNADDGQPDKLRVVSGGEEGAKKRTVQRTLEYRLDGGQFTSGIMGGRLKVLYAFPFLRDEDANDSFTVGGKVSLFFADKDMTLRTGNDGDALHLVKNDIGNSSVANPANGVFNIPLKEKSLPVSGVKDEESALNDTITFDFNETGAATKFSSWLGANPVFRVTRQWEQTREEKPDGGFSDWEPQNPDDKAAIVEPTECLLPPLLANGSVNGDFTSFAKFKGIAAGAGPEVTLRMCVWLYVKNSEGKVVDLVPACMKDDDQLLSKNNFATMGPDGTTIGGTPYPLMMFPGATIGYAPDSVKTVNGQDAGIEAPGAFMCSDPRWNWAPEHWFAMPGGFGKQNWLDNCQRKKDNRDRDIFMATSDAGYLQSVYELAFLPRLTNLESSGASKRLGDTEAVSVSRTTLPANFEETRNKPFMWRTYSPFKVNGRGPDDFIGVGFTSRGRGPRVNPFADSDTAILAALANTPTSWMVASTNENAEASVPKSERKAEDFNKKHCFNMMGPAENKFEWDDLREIAASLKTAMRRDDGDWEKGYRLAWEDESNEDIFAGAELSGSTVDLYDVDRKFLYGYWHDCFAPKQQLFLVFVRAEPMMMGGGAIGQTPPQLGARAVALVWRDPVKRGSQDGDPHQTRVLFYRQFD